MKRFAAVAALALLSLGLARSELSGSYRVAFDLTSRDSLDQRAVLRWIKEITSSDPQARIEVVMYGKGFELVMPERSTVSADVQAALMNPNVVFTVCEVALRNNQVARSQLFGGVTTVPDGIRELVAKQQEDWGYIKVGH
jgi:intracellular sulfur oxidation DsrE/DsrF family protein